MRAQQARFTKVVRAAIPVISVEMMRERESELDLDSKRCSSSGWRGCGFAQVIDGRSRQIDISQGRRHAPEC